MPSPNGSPVVADINAVPAPQFWDNVAQAYAYLYGDATRGEHFTRQAPIVPYHSAGYEIGHQIKTSAGTFFGVSGGYKSTVNVAWIMVFDSNGVPTTGAFPLTVTSVGPITTGSADLNWFINPGKPYIFNNGLYIALSTTGGAFTASANTDLFMTVEYV